MKIFITSFLFLVINTTPTYSGSINYETHAAIVPKEQKAFAECVSWQESRHNYRAVGDISSARGRWQFLDAQWRNGLAFMVSKRLVDFGMPKNKQKKLIKKLRNQSIDQWKPIYQDIGFLAALNWKYQWSGWRHWHVDNSKCNDLVPKYLRSNT